MKKIILIVFLIFCFLFVLLNIGSGDEEKTELEIELESLETEPTEPRIVIKDSGPEYKVFHFTVKVADGSYKVGDNANKISKNDADFLNSLSKIPGVAFVRIEPYEVTIKRGGAFKWKEIEPNILKILLERFGEDKNKVKIISSEEAQSF